MGRAQPGPEFPFCSRGADRAAAEPHSALLPASPQTQPVCIMKAEMEESTGTPLSPRSHPHSPQAPGAIRAVRGGGQHAVYFNFSESFEGDFPLLLLNSDEPLGRLGHMWFRAHFFFLLYFCCGCCCCCCNSLLLTLSGRVPQGHLHPGVPEVGGDPTRALGVPSHAHLTPEAQHVLPWPSPQEMGIDGKNMEISPKPHFISSWCCRFQPTLPPARSLPVHHCLLLSWPRRSGESMQCTQTCSDHTLQVAARSYVGQCMEPGARAWVKSDLGTSGATLGFTPCPSPPAPCSVWPTSHPRHPIPKSQSIGSCAWSFSIAFNFLKGELLIYFWNNVGEEEGKMALKSTTKLPPP